MRNRKIFLATILSIILVFSLILPASAAATPSMVTSVLYGHPAEESSCSSYVMAWDASCLAAINEHNMSGDHSTWSSVTESVPTTTWNCPLGGVALIAPNPTAGRPELTEPVACVDIAVSAGAQLWGIYHLVETGPDAGTWLWYVPGFVTSTLTQLEPGKYYWVVVSDPCNLTISLP